MKSSITIHKLFVLGASAVIGISAALPCWADDEINLEEMRRTLSRQAAAGSEPGTAAMPAKDFTLSDSEIEAVNKKYEAEEAELLKKLASPDAQKLLKDVISGKSDVDPIEDRAPIVPAALTARAETILKDARPDAEAAPLERSVRSDTFESPDNAKASLKVNNDDKIIQRDLITTVPTTKLVQRPASDAALKGLQSQVTTLRKNNSELNAKLQKADAQVTELTRQLEEAKNRLMLAETEVERLAGVIETRNRSAALKFGGASEAAGAPVVTQVVQRSAPKATEDTPIATVVSEKANLRTGPGAEHSPLMSVSRGTRLLVETRNGNWYRVISPSGTRAWVSSDVVAFGPSPMSAPTRTVKIRGFDAALENETFGTGSKSSR